MNNSTFPKYLFLTVAVLLFAICPSQAQVMVSGTVYDSSKLYVVPDVEVHNSSGSITLTDSSGKYNIVANKGDSISFYYNGKYTLKFPVDKMQDYQAFDISLRVKVTDKYKLLKGVTVFSNSYRMDSLENRETYAKVFGNSKPGLKSTYDPGGAAGLDIGELVGVFQFRKNKHRLAFQNRLIEEEEDKYVDHRFSIRTIERITGLKSPESEEYRKQFRPNYYFTSTSTLAQFYEYILKTSYRFKQENGIE